MNEKDGLAEWVTGYRAGYELGYQAGLSNGRSQGWDNAKWRAFEALEAQDVKAAMTEHFTKQEIEK